MDFETNSRLFFLLCIFCTVIALPEPGVWKEVPIPKDTTYLTFVKNMYKDTIVSVEIHCTPDEVDVPIRVEWVLRYSPCTQEYHSFDGLSTKDAAVAIDRYLNKPNTQLYKEFNYKTVQFLKYSEEVSCSAGKPINLKDHTKEPPKNESVYIPELDEMEDGSTRDDSSQKNVTDHAANAAVKATKPKSTQNDQAARKKRADDAEKSTVKPAATTPTTESVSPFTDFSTPAAQHPPNVDDQKSEYHVGKVWKSGSYIFILNIEKLDGKHADATVTVRMKSKVGYISAFEWPLLIFYGVMGIVYIIYGLVWLVMLACNWRDLLRIQYWIGAVIVLGMLEKAVFFSEYQSITNTGTSVTDGAEVFAEIVSCLKRSLARMLVIIASLGFGIVKPRLGPAFHKVLFVGGLYFVLATVEGCMRSLRRKGDQSTDLMLAQVPLAVLDAAICWWIFSSLMQTIRQLRLRRNIVKLTLYRHFTNTLIFAVLASIIFMIWSVIQIKSKTCLKDWQELWVDDAFWHLLFSIILLVIMVLWRPSSNNQRYAFSPLLDAADDEEEDDTVMNDAFDGMKMRTKQVNGSPKQKQTTIEDDLKWVEENIPSAISDKASTLLDSDEEIMTAKYEMSKMQ